MTWCHLLSYPWPWAWIKNLNAMTTKYIPKCVERSLKRKSNLSFIRIFWSMFSICMWFGKTFLKILCWWQFLVPCSEHLLLALQLYCVRHKILWLCQCSYWVYYNCVYNTNSFYLWSFSTTGLLSSLIKV